MPPGIWAYFTELAEEITHVAVKYLGLGGVLVIASRVAFIPVIASTIRCEAIHSERLPRRIRLAVTGRVRLIPLQ